VAEWGKRVLSILSSESGEKKKIGQGGWGWASNHQKAIEQPEKKRGPEKKVWGSL